MGSHSLLQGVFLNQKMNQSLLRCREILYQLSYQVELKNIRVGGLSLLQGIFLTQKLNQSLLHCREILYQLSLQGSPVEEG